MFARVAVYGCANDVVNVDFRLVLRKGIANGVATAPMVLRKALRSCLRVVCI